MDPDLPLAAIQSMDQIVSESIAQPRLIAGMVGAFAASALLLAAVGLYGVMAYSVTRRTKEIGLRMALGAERRQVLDMILMEGAGVAMAGIALGVPAALVLSRLLTSLLFDVRPSDASSLVAPLAIMLGAAIVAVLLPAWRAARVEPMAALRDE
jgi:putative ABC transport system permease protein